MQPGWTTAGFDSTQDGTGFLLNSDRSVFDFITFGVMLWGFHAGRRLVHRRASRFTTHHRLRR